MEKVNGWITTRKDVVVVSRNNCWVFKTFYDAVKSVEISIEPKTICDNPYDIWWEACC